MNCASFPSSASLFPSFDGKMQLGFVDCSPTPRAGTSPEALTEHRLYTRRARETLIRVSPEHQASKMAVTTAGDERSSSVSIDSGSDVVRNFYGGINRHDLASVENLIADNCVYEDLVFTRPFVGRRAILDFFKKFTDYVSTDLQFVIDDISDDDFSAVGLTWHMEWQGKPFPFSKGCSFYRLEVVNGKRQIIYGRDTVEPFIKPGETTLVAIRGLTWLLQRFPQLADRL